MRYHLVLLVLIGVGWALLEHSVWKKRVGVDSEQEKTFIEREFQLRRKEERLEEREKEVARKEKKQEELLGTLLKTIEENQREIRAFLGSGFKDLAKRCQFLKMDLGDFIEEFRVHAAEEKEKAADRLQRTIEFCRQHEQETMERCRQLWEEAEAQFSQGQARDENGGCSSPVYTFGAQGFQDDVD